MLYIDYFGKFPSAIVYVFFSDLKTLQDCWTTHPTFYASLKEILLDWGSGFVYFLQTVYRHFTEVR
jgi:hypothetical protein